jgi:hypothetical protein
MEKSNHRSSFIGALKLAHFCPPNNASACYAGAMEAPTGNSYSPSCPLIFIVHRVEVVELEWRKK